MDAICDDDIKDVGGGIMDIVGGIMDIVGGIMGAICVDEMMPSPSGAGIGEGPVVADDVFGKGTKRPSTRWRRGIAVGIGSTETEETFGTVHEEEAAPPVN